LKELAGVGGEDQRGPRKRSIKGRRNLGVVKVEKAKCDGEGK